MATVVGPLMQQLLTRYGLGSLAPWMAERIIKNTSEEQIMLELYDRPEFKLAFPEIEARRKLSEGGATVAPISPEEVLNYRTQARSLMQSYGLPPSFYAKNSDFFDLIVNDVSMDELNWRLENVTQRAVHAPPEVKAAFAELFGDQAEHALFEVFVDHERAMPHLENLLQQYEFKGAAGRFGFDISADRSLVGDVYNLTYEEAVQGFGLLDAQRGLFEETISEDEDFEVDEEGINAAFGVGSGAAEKLSRRGEARSASTQGSSGGGGDARGPTGLGGAGLR